MESNSSPKSMVAPPVPRPRVAPPPVPRPRVAPPLAPRRSQDHAAPCRRENPRCASAGAASRPPPPYCSQRSRWLGCGRRRRTRTGGRRCGSGGGSVQGGHVRGPALRRERVDGLGPHAGRSVRPHHGRRPRRQEPRSLPMPITSPMLPMHL